MPGRKNPLVTDNYYHVFNRGVAKLPLFTEKNEYKRAIELIDYYQFSNVTIKYSDLISLPFKEQQAILQKIKQQNKLFVKILTFTLMTNHFHFTLVQMVDRGIAKFIANFSNSYCKYFNIKHDRVGPLFQGRFRAKHIKSEEQLIHLSRYHHLNPYTDGAVTSHAELLSYSYSSLPDYIGTKVNDFVDTELILSYFKRKSLYKKFVLAHADYQRKLGRIKHLLMEQPANFVPAHTRGG